MKMFQFLENMKRHKGAVNVNRRALRTLAFESLESRAMLSAFSLAGYDDGVGMWNLDLNLSNPVTAPAGTYTDYSGVAYSDASDTLFIVDNEDTKIFEYDRAGTYLRNINLNGFVDTEGVYHLGGTRFAVVEEKGDGAMPNENFSLSIFSIPAGPNVTITKSAIVPSLPASGTIVLSHTLMNDTPGNNGGLEGIAYDPAGFVYVGQELTDVRVFRVPDIGGTTQEVVIPTVTGPPGPEPILADLSDLFFVRNADYPNGRLFLMSDDSQRIIMADLDATGLAGTVVTDGTGAVIDVALPQQAFEGVGFSPNSFEMYAIADDDVPTELRRVLQFRNFTVFNPPAPNLADGSDTGVMNNDDITSATTPTFNGTLTRTLATGTIPVENASVWLYVDGVRVGTAVSTNATGFYSITAPTLAPGPRVIQIRVAETGTFDDTKTSPLSPTLTVTIDTQMPRVIQVVVRHTLNTVHPAWSILGGLDLFEMSHQLRPIPIGGGINQVSVRFGEPLDTLSLAAVQNALTLYGENRGSNYDVSAGFSYDSAAWTATWTLATNTTMHTEKWTLTLNHPFVLDPSGNRLDGNWTNPENIWNALGASYFPSGNGVQDANDSFVFKFMTLRGDVNRDGIVNRPDEAVMTMNSGMTTGAQWTQGDITGDGAINLADFYRLQQAFGTNYQNWPGSGGQQMTIGGGAGGEQFLVLPGEEAALLDAETVAALDLWYWAAVNDDPKLFSELRSRVRQLEASGNTAHLQILIDLLAATEN